MRPRLTEPEVKFLLDLLEPKRKEAEERYANSFSRLEPERNQLRTFLERVSRHLISSSQEETEQKRQRLDTVQKEIDSNWNQMVLYRGLITRFEDLLGHKKRGRLKSETEMSRIYMKKQVEPEGMKELASKETTDLVDLATARAWEALTKTLNNPTERTAERGPEPEPNAVIVASPEQEPEPNVVIVPEDKASTPSQEQTGQLTEDMLNLYDSFMERIGKGILPPCSRVTATLEQPVKEEPSNDDGKIPFVLKPERKKRKPNDGKTHFVLTFGS